ncbi:hypothetical protein PG997_005400 [Apiospora hydei]|uniref:Uncharacterized protein n=1 Tax=Apiospora hydei TaxID=1337664 RepID=A0ABR1X507_9PEZI
MSELPVPLPYFIFVTAPTLVGWLQIGAVPFIPERPYAAPPTLVTFAATWVAVVWLLLAPLVTILLLLCDFGVAVPAFVFATSLVQLYFSKKFFMLPRSDAEKNIRLEQRMEQRLEEKQETMPLRKGPHGTGGHYVWDGSHLC